MTTTNNIDEMHTTMNTIERKVTLQILDDALKAGCVVSVHDGGETAIQESTDKEVIFQAMFSTHADTLYLYKDNRVVGWVWLIWGNDCDVISDYANNPFMEELLAPAMEIANA